MKFKIYIRKLHRLPPGELQPPFFFAKTNTLSCNVLDSPSSLQSQQNTTPRSSLLSTTPKECMDVNGHMVTWLPNFLRWIADYQIVLAMGLRLHALHALVELCYKFTCEITKMPCQHSVDTSVSMWLTLDKHSTNMWPALSWHMDWYVSQHSVDMSTDSSYLMTIWLTHLGEHWSAEGRSRIQTLAGPTLRVFK